MRRVCPFFFSPFPRVSSRGLSYVRQVSHVDSRGTGGRRLKLKKSRPASRLWKNAHVYPKKDSQGRLVPLWACGLRAHLVCTWLFHDAPLIKKCQSHASCLHGLLSHCHHPIPRPAEVTLILRHVLLASRTPQRFYACFSRCPPRPPTPTPNNMELPKSGSEERPRLGVPVAREAGARHGTWTLAKRANLVAQRAGGGEGGACGRQKGFLPSISGLSGGTWARTWVGVGLQSVVCSP